MAEVQEHARLAEKVGLVAGRGVDLDELDGHLRPGGLLGQIDLAVLP